MEIKWDRDAGLMSYADQVIPVQCWVRNELNGQRKLTEKAVYSEGPDGKPGVPYMPRPFPKGRWQVISIDSKENPYEAPEFMGTDACQLVEEWSINPDGTYKAPTGRMVMDWGYGFHNSSSTTTLGCGRVLGTLDGETPFSTAARKALMDAVRAAQAALDEAWITVI